MGPDAPRVSPRTAIPPPLRADITFPDRLQGVPVSD